MPGKMVRAQIILEAEQHRSLQERSHAMGVSISELVRAAVSRQMQDEQDEQSASHLAAVAEVRSLRASILSRRAGRPIDNDAATFIGEIRDERDEEIGENGDGDCN
jgi:hypothetical protein